MIKTLYTIGINQFLTAPLLASTGNFSITELLILLVAVAALILGIVNFFRIKRVRHIHDVDFLNQKEDFTLTLERFKSSLSQGYKNPQKEFPKQLKNQKNEPNKPHIRPVIKTTEPAAESNTETPDAAKTDISKSPKPKKKYYHRRRPGLPGEKKQGPKE